MTQSEPPPATPPEDPSFSDPGFAPPSAPPGGSAPPSHQWSGPPPGPPARPGLVTTAAIVLIVLGVLTAIVGVFALLAASLFSSGMDIPGMEQFGEGAAGAVGGALVVIGAVIIVFGVLQVVSGINLFSARSWARILGIVLAVIGGLFGLLAAIPSSSANSSPVFGLILLVAYAFTVWVLATTGRYFTR